VTKAVRRALRAGAGLVGVALLAAGCGFGGAGDTHGKDDAAPKVSQAQIRITPEDGAHDVRLADPFMVEVTDGRLTSVKVENADGTVVGGKTDAGGRSWRPTAALTLSTRYTVDAYAVDGDGRAAAKHAVFTTLVPKNTFIGFFTPEDGSTVGTGMIVSLVFSHPVANRGAVRRAIVVRSEPAVEVASHWFGAQRLDFRPESYWTPGTKVTLDLRLRDVEGAPGVYGTQAKEVRFTIGRDQRSTVETDTHTMTVRRDGQVFKVLPVTAGSPSNPTYNGRMVITEKLPLTRMNGQTVGFGGEYDIPDVPHAMRLTRSGTFIHGSYWAPPGTFGAVNTSHGCVGLYDVKGGGSNTPAGWMFDHSLVGDVVNVVNPHDRTVAPDNGLGGWNLTWRQWLAG
jgi:lipoprotein-anchoring transpeptidase ErfK/SrfK